MARAFRGEPIVGSGTVYAVPRDQELALYMLTFTLTCSGSSGPHAARVRFVDAGIAQTVAVLRDQNEATAGDVVRYTYGVGLVGSTMWTVNGWDATNALPQTVLDPGTQIIVEAVNDAGATIVGDTITAIALYGDLVAIADTGGDVTPLLPGLLPA